MTSPHPRGPERAGPRVATPSDGASSASAAQGSPARELIVGIDLGTTNSLVAVAGWPSPSARPRVLAPIGGSALLPSVVRFEPSGVVVVGEQARREAPDHPRTTIASVKRLMGRSIADAAPDLPMLSYKVVQGPGHTARVELPSDGTTYAPPRTVSPQQVSAHILAALKQRAQAVLTAELGTPVEVRKAVITVPAYFDDAQRQATRDAAQIAGLDPVRLVAEPTAAALAYGLGLRAAGALTPPGQGHASAQAADAGKLVAVYDLGGGTFDVSFLRITSTGLGAEAFQVLSTSGDTRLGGDDMDFAIVRWVAQQLDARSAGSGAALLNDPGQRRALLASAERAKVVLSSEPSATIEPPTGLHAPLTLTRGDFEALITPLVDRTLNACRRAQRDAQRASTGEPLAAVILVGGATRVPLVRARVAQFFGLTPYTAIDPDCAVALGAAVQASVMNGAEAGALLLDVIPLSLGLETVGGAMAKIVMRNSPVPAQAHEMFSTSVDGQTSVKLNILQGEREMAADCRSLGEFHLRGIPPMPAGIPQLRVTFTVDANAILNVTAHELRTGTRVEVQVVPNHGLTRDEVARIELESFANAREDMRRHRVADLVANSTLDLGWIDRQLARHAAALTPAQRSAIESAAQTLRGFLARAGANSAAGPKPAADAPDHTIDPDAFHAAKEALDRASMPLHEAAITSTLRASEGRAGATPSP